MKSGGFHPPGFHRPALVVFGLIPAARIAEEKIKEMG